MKSNIFKKIITLIYLLTFLFSFFVPFNLSFAEDPTETNPLIISTAKNILLPGKSTEITAKLYSVGGETVSFSAFYTNGPGLTEFPDFQTLSQGTCIPLGNTHSNIVSCSVTFSSAREKTYIIKASITRNGQTFSSPNITILIAKPITDNQQSSVDTDTTYTPLAPLPGLPGEPYETNTECPFGNYLNIIIKLVIGIAAVLAMVMIVMGGIEYMTSDLISSKESGKDTIRNAILGLLIALGAYLILNTINPQLLSVCLDLPDATITIQPLYDRGFNDPKQANGESIRCTPVLSGPCSVANLTPIFGDKAVAMSKICNMESSGTNATSGTDVCKPSNNSFSFGLFQINLAANGKLAGADCVGLFDRAVSSKDAIEPKYTSGFTCSLLPGKETLYNTCKARLLNADTNLAIAKSLFLNSKGMENWSGDKRFCASAFK